MVAYTGIDNYASMAFSSNNNAASFLLSGTIEESGNALAIAYNPYSSGTNPYTIVWSTSSDGLIASPSFNMWPGLAWASPTATLSMLETQAGFDINYGGSSRMDVYAGNVQDSRSIGQYAYDPRSTSVLDYKGAASTGTSHSMDAVFVAQTAI